MRLPQIRLALFLAAALALTPLAMAQPALPPITLSIGDTAPNPAFGKWVKGEAVTKFEPGTVYVLECWATWCGPCVAAIPHVTELQKKYEGKVIFIGVDVWEQDESKVEPFVTKMGDKMGYRVAMDDKSKHEQGAVATEWLLAAGQTGIPCSFIIDQKGKLAWIGHPMELENSLSEVVAGTYDLQAAASKGKMEQERTALVNNARADIAAAVATKDPEELIKAVDKHAKKIPDLAEESEVVKFQIILGGMNRPDEAYALIEKAFDSLKGKSKQLNDVATTIVMGPGIKTRRLEIAYKFAQEAVKASEEKDATYLATLARVEFDRGRVAEAIAAQEKAVAVATDELKPEIVKRLTEMKSGRNAPAGK